MTDAQLIICLSLLAGALALDETAFLQAMISQPLVASSIAGLAAGNLGIGLAVGATLQLVWVGVLPVGAAPFPDGAVAGVAGVGVGVLLSRAGLDGGLPLAAAVLTGVIAGSLGQPVISLVRRINVRYEDLARRRAEQGETGGVSSAVALGLATRYTAGAVMAALFLVAGALAAGPLATALVAKRGSTFPTLLWAAPIACAAVAATSRGRRDRMLMLAGFAAGLVVVFGLGN
jgi:PTS system mannose-specific IIC component